ncbi:MAG: hypothetical protein QW176_03625 [Candidatus Bathyarchaeia archaeon]
MERLDFIVDLVEERLVRGGLRWLANFREIRRDRRIGEFTIPLYASGGLEERGFLLSRVFSALVTPKYKVHLLIYTSDAITAKLLRRLVISCKDSFGPDDWIFIGLVQARPFEKTVRDAIENLADERVGIVAYSLESREEPSSDNLLGRALRRHLKLGEAKFEALDPVNYVKSFTIAFLICASLLMLLSPILRAVTPVHLIVAAALSIILGHRIYKARYHTILLLDDEGFKLWRGRDVIGGEWSSFTDVAIYITPKHELNLRLFSDEGSVDLPLSRVGLPRRDTYRIIRNLISKADSR